MTVRIFTIAELPDELAQAWMQHLRDFDTKHEGCHFQVAAQMMDAVKLNPGLAFTSITRKR